MAIIKADAYGHGAVPVARAAIEASATYLGVALMEGPGTATRRHQVPILVLGALSNEDCAQCVRDEISACAFCPNRSTPWKRRQRHAEKWEKHAKIDSGFHRIGVYPEDLGPVLEAFKACEHVEMEGILRTLPRRMNRMIRLSTSSLRCTRKQCKSCARRALADDARVQQRYRCAQTCHGAGYGARGIILYGCVPSVDTPRWARMCRSPPSHL